MKMKYEIIIFFMLLIFCCGVGFCELNGIGSYNFMKNKFINQLNTDNLTSNSTNVIQSNLSNVVDNNSVDNGVAVNSDNMTDNNTLIPISNNLDNGLNNSLRRRTPITSPNIGLNTNGNANLNTNNTISDTSQWLERIEVSDYKPDAGDTITIEGFGWNPNAYRDGIEITLSGGGSSDLRIGRIVPDSNGHFKIKYKLPKTYKYNDVIEIRCNGEAVALLQIND